MSEREKLVEVMLTAMSEHHSGNFAEAALIVEAQLAALEAAAVRLVPVEVEVEAINTNDLRDYADRISNPYAQFILDAASQLDYARTDRNILQAELDAERARRAEVEDRFPEGVRNRRGERRVRALSPGAPTS